MKVDLTTVEAKRIYTERYLEGRGKKQMIPMAILLIALVTCVFVAMFNEWLGVGVFIVLASPSVIIYLRTMRECRRYTKKSIEEAP